MLTFKRIAEAVRALAAGRMPDEVARAALCDAIARANAGLCWPKATGRQGGILRAERDQALRLAARQIDPDAGPWEMAGLLGNLLRRSRLAGVLADAKAAGADKLKRGQIYSILRVETEAPGRCNLEQAPNSKGE